MLAALSGLLSTLRRLLAQSGLTGARMMWALWALTRAIMLVGAITGARWCDPWFYHYAGELHAGHLPYRDVPVEYPPLAMALILAPALVVLPFAAIAPQPDAAFSPPLTHLPTPDPARYAAYGLAFAGMMLLIDALTLRTIARVARRMVGGQSAPVAGALYLVLTLLTGGVLQKFDLVVGTLLLVAALALLDEGRVIPWLALGAAALVKGFPVLIVPAFACFLIVRAEGDSLAERARAAREPLLRGAIALATVIAAPAMVIALWAGPGAVWHTVTYHTGRGLEIESIPATLAVLASGLLRLHVVTAFHAGDLSRVVISPMDGLARALGELLGAALLAGWLVQLARALRLRHFGAMATSDQAGWLLLATMAPMLSFMMAFGALPLHYLLVLAPMAVLWCWPIGAETRLWRVSLVGVVVAGALVIALWDSVRALAPWAFASLVVRNGAWVCLSIACIMGMSRMHQQLVERTPDR